jgi:hypothetical protein
MATARYKYESNAGNIFYARTDSDSELDSIRGGQPAGVNTEYMTFEFSKNAKQVGCRPRSAVLKRSVVGGLAGGDGCVSIGGSRVKYVIVLTRQHYDTLILGQVLNINGLEYTLVSKRREEMR